MIDERKSRGRASPAESVSPSFAAVVIGLTIKQEPDGFSRGDGRATAGSADQLGKRRHTEIVPGRKGVALVDDTRLLGGDKFRVIDVGAIIVVCDQSAVLRIHPGLDGRPVHVRRGQIDRVMIPKSHAFLRELPQDWSGLGAHEIRPHSVPHDDDHMSIFCEFRRRDVLGYEAGQGKRDR